MTWTEGNMTGGRYCSTCNTRHEGASGEKCPTLHQNDPDNTLNAESHTPDTQIPTATINATAQQVLASENQDQPGGAQAQAAGQNSHEVILRELSNISKQFISLQEQATHDRQILAGLVTEVGKQNSTVQQLMSDRPNAPSTKHSLSTSDVQQRDSQPDAQRHLSGPGSGEVRSSSLFDPVVPDEGSRRSRGLTLTGATSLPAQRAHVNLRDTRPDDGNRVLSVSQPSTNMDSQGNPHSSLAFAQSQDRTREHVIPSLQTLRGNADTHRRVNQRFQELEEASTFGDSGNWEMLLETLQKKAQMQNKAKIKWPQDLAFVGTQRRRPTYEQLNVTQWMLGYLRIWQEESNPDIQNNMIHYLTELMQDACDYSWEGAKGAHSVLLHRMGDGIVDWSNLKEINKIRKRYAQTNSNSTGQDKNKPPKPVPCIQFNRGTCTRTADHEFKGMLLKHICHFCYQNYQKFEGHSKKECWRANRELPKN